VCTLVEKKICLARTRVTVTPRRSGSSDRPLEIQQFERSASRYPARPTLRGRSPRRSRVSRLREIRDRSQSAIRVRQKRITSDNE